MDDGDLAISLRPLRDAVLEGVGRAADMGIVDFLMADCGLTATLHIQCPFRILHGGVIVLGSDDMSYSKKSQPDTGDWESVFDERSATLNGIVAEMMPRVEDVDLQPGGALMLTFSHSLVCQVFPHCSGQVEMWRFFVRGGPHHGFPASTI